ncbi:MAG: hypothetical protein WC497_03585 [Patescibacteria group bacterium]
MNNQKSTKVLLLLLPMLFLLGLSCGTKKSTTDGGVFRSTNRGESWEQKVFVETLKKKTITIGNVDVRKLLFDPQNSDTLYAGTNGHGLFKTTNSGDQWQKLSLAANQITSLDINPKNTGTLYAASGRNLYRSVDGGENWKVVYTEDRAEDVVYNVVVDPFEPLRIYVSNDAGGVFKSYDGGDSWQKIYWFKKAVSLVRLSPRDSRIVFAAVNDDAGLYISLDGGENWTSQAEALKAFGKNGKNIHDIVFDPNKPQTLYLATDYGLLKSNDEGQSWEAMKTLLNFNTPISLVAVNPLNSNQIYHTDQSVLYRSDDGGFNWSTLRTLPSKRRISQLLIHPTQPEILYAGVFTIQSK